MIKGQGCCTARLLLPPGCEGPHPARWRWRVPRDAPGSSQVEPSAVAQLRVRCLGMLGWDWLGWSWIQLYFTP